MDLISVVYAAQEATNVLPEKENVIDLLGINWKLFLGQLVNFGIVLFVLWKWVFKPVTAALTQRTQKIEKSLREAEKIKKQVEELEVFKASERKKANIQSEKIIKEAAKIGVEQKQEMLGQAKSEAARIIKEAQGRINIEKTQMIAEVKEEIGDLVIVAVEKIISEKIDQQKDAVLIKESLKSLNKVKKSN